MSSRRNPDANEPTVPTSTTQCRHGPSLSRSARGRGGQTGSNDPAPLPGTPALWDRREHSRDRWQATTRTPLPRCSARGPVWAMREEPNADGTCRSSRVGSGHRRPGERSSPLRQHITEQPRRDRNDHGSSPGRHATDEHRPGRRSRCRTSARSPPRRVSRRTDRTRRGEPRVPQVQQIELIRSDVMRTVGGVGPTVAASPGIGRSAGVRAPGVASGALAAAARAGAERSGRAGAREAGRRAAEPGVVPPAPAPRRRAGDGASQLRRRARQLLHHRPRRLPRRAADRRGGAASRAPPRPCRRHPTARPPVRRRPRVLFLCTGNSARSQMAEALLEHMSAGTIDAASAGSHPKPLHPNAVRVLRTRGIDISANRTKHLDEFVAQRFDTVITLCDRVREVCPEFRSATRAGALERARPGARGPDQPRLVPGVRAHRRRARDAHQLPAPPARRRTNDEEDTPMPNDEIVNVRYMVDDVEESIDLLHRAARLRGADERGARVRRRQARQPPAAALRARRARPAGRCPTARRPARAAGTGSTSSSTTSTPRSAASASAGAAFRNDIVEGPGGKQILLQDPSGNVVELFQPAAR